MLPITATRAKSEWEGVKPLPGLAGEDNVAWLERASTTLLPQLGGKYAKQVVKLVLLGGTDPVSFRLRLAQAHLRHDLTPSSWSHVMLLQPHAPSLVYEISLEPRNGFRYPVPTNGLQSGELDYYRDVIKYPNIALVAIPSGDILTSEKLENMFSLFQKQRTTLDGLELVVRWLAFVWGAGRGGNPLLEGYGIPSSAMLEVVFNALGHDLTPGLESRSSCPEAIWQAIKWWHEYYSYEGRLQARCLHRVDHQLVPPIETVNEDTVKKVPPRKPKRRKRG